jgi:hypothetical protein
MKPAFALALSLALAIPGLARAEVSILESASAKTVDCTADPEVSIDGSANTITLGGACTKISVNGSQNVVVAASVVKISINGAQNQVDLGAVDKISVNGTSNKVTYKSSVGKKKTKTSKTGIGNSVKKVK